MMPSKRPIDLASYARADILRAFNARQMPQFSTTCEVDVTGIKRVAASMGASFFVAMSYAISRAVNAVPEFRHRFINGVLYEFDRVDPGYTVAREGDLFSFCDSVYDEDFRRYSVHAMARMEAVKAAPDLGVGDKDQMFFITSIPWFSFTAFTHPYDPVYAYIPVITLGKTTERGGSVFMPIAVQVHHGVVDGLHVGRFYAAVGALSEQAGEWLI
ncbi:MAG: chloramphenicol acetyltransferase [Pseudomonadota bacterium]